MDTRKILIFTLGLLLSFVPKLSKGQNPDSLFYFTGDVISKRGSYPVALAHIINITKKWGVVADTLGHFEIWAEAGDTLNISAIGFEYLEYPVKKISNDTSVSIVLEGRSYEIPGVAISYFGTYKEFEYKVINLELPEIKFNEQVEKIFKSDVTFTPYVEPTVSSPASLVYNLFSKKAKAIKKYAELKENEEVNTEVRERYNEHIIKNLTGLEGDEIGAFMTYCDFKDTFIISVTDYKLYSKIMSKFEEFKKSKNDNEKTE